MINNIHMTRAVTRQEQFGSHLPSNDVSSHSVEDSQFGTDYQSQQTFQDQGPDIQTENSLNGLTIGGHSARREGLETPSEHDDPFSGLSAGWANARGFLSIFNGRGNNLLVHGQRLDDQSGISLSG